jgi:GNAT superfamily N-acetyltransferase
MSVREATAADIDAMHQIRLAVRENVLSDPRKVLPDHYYRFLGATGKSWVYVVKEQVVGFAAADSRSGNIWALFVHPDFERQGIGRQLHETMMQWLFGTGCDRAWLTTQPNSRADFFYHHAGWQAIDSMADGDVLYEMRRKA